MDKTPNRMPKIITVDLDGTLFLRDHTTLGARTYQALSAYVACGTELVPATGRCVGLIPAENMPPVNYMISCNGAVIYDVRNDKIIHSDYIPKEHLIAAWEIIREYDVMLELFAEKDVVIERRVLENLDKYKKQIPIFQPQYFRRGLATVVESFDEYIEREGTRVAKINLPGKNIDHCPELLDRIRATGFFDVSSDGENMEATNKGCNKGEGLKWLCRYLGISLEEAVSFGDGDNDIPILTCAGWGVAMGNSKDFVKAHASHCTASHTEDGIALFLEKTFSIPTVNP